MATKTAVEIQDELDDLLLEDASAVDAPPWTEARKQRALNRAIRSSWPHFKVPVEVTQHTAPGDLDLVADTYVYNLTGLTDVEDIGNGVGIVQCLLEPLAASQDWIQLRTVTQRRNGTTWALYVPESIVSNYAEQGLKLRYYRRLAEFSAWNAAETQPAEFVNYILYKAAVELFGLFAQGGSDFNVEDMLKLIPLYEQRAADELKKNTVYCMPVLVGVRSEASV